MAPEASSALAIEGLQPAPLWQFFAQLSAIPRPSKHEQGVQEWLHSFAQQRGLAFERDAVGNIVIRRPGSGGGERAPPVVIQGHIDMVCEKNKDVVHDFFKDGIELVREGDWLKAKGTTLGADNGIGVCAALALLDAPPTTKLPPLECLFTVDEETGLTGAFQIGVNLEGRTMLNLDTEDWGELFIGCAGGGDSKLWLEGLPLQPAPEGLVPFELKVGGLLGGHSGIDIATGRGNAVQLLAHALRKARDAAGGRIWLAAAAAGDKRNAIAREGAAAVLLAEADAPAARQAVASCLEHFIAEYGTLEKNLTVQLAPSPSPPAGHVLEPAALDRVLRLVSVLPHGPVKFSHTVPGLVETSSNVASLHVTQQQQGGAAAPSSATALIVTSTRSSLGPALEAVRDRIEAAAQLAGARVERGKAYPGWQPNLDSQVLQLTKQAYRELTGGEEAKVGAIHAGLECGILAEKYSGMDTVSFGPTIKGAHSPDERCQISTVPPFWDLTLRVLGKLADRKA